MIAFDNGFYIYVSDGLAEKLKPEETTPFAMYVFWKRNELYGRAFECPIVKKLKALYNELMPSKNYFYVFEWTVRSVK